MKNLHPSGYDKILLDINLTTGEIKRTPMPQKDVELFIGGRGLGMKILWDRLQKPGIDALSPENPLMFMPGPFSGFPIPSASRTVVVTKSPCTSPETSPHPHASTISYSNMGGFLMEAREKGYITKSDLDGIDLTWGNVDAVISMLDKITRRDGIGDLAAQGVKETSRQVGRDSKKFAIHVKGLELAAHNIHANPPRALCYATSNRGACHLSGDNIAHQNFIAAVDSLGLCLFASDHNKWMMPGISSKKMANLLTSITGIEYDTDKFMKAGERVFNLEKMFNLREGFTRADDALPERFFADAFTMGPEKGAKLDRQEFSEMMDTFYTERNWDPATTRPSDEKLEQLGLGFTV